MHVENVEIFSRTVFHHDVIVIFQRSYGDSSRGDEHPGVSGLEPEIRRFQRGGVIPGGFGRKSKILLIPELPDTHFPLKDPRDLPIETKQRQQIPRQCFRIGLRPFRSIMIHPGYGNSLIREKRGVFQVGLPVELLRPGFHFAPTHTLPGHAHTGAAKWCDVFRLPRIVAIHNRPPAQRGIESKKAIRIDVGNRNDGKTAISGERNAVPGFSLQKVVAVRQRRQLQHLLAACDISALQNRTVPAAQNPAAGSRSTLFQVKQKRFPVEENGSGSSCGKESRSIRQFPGVQTHTTAARTENK